MKTTNKNSKANTSLSSPSINTYIHGFNSYGAVSARVCKVELDLLIERYKEGIKVLRRNKEKTAFAIAKYRLSYWERLRFESEWKD